MYFCIFGFQRLVWWPKCTPASSSSFIVSVAMQPPSVCPPPRSGASLRPNVRGARDGVLRRVLTVDPYVLLAEVAGEDLLLSAPQPQVDRDGVLLPCHDLADPLEAHAVPQHAPLDDPLVLKEDRDLLLLHARGRLAEGHHDPPPVGVSAVDRALHQRRVRHAARGQQGVATAGRAAYGDGDELGRALAVGDQHPRELRPERPEPGGELAQAPPALLDRPGRPAARPPSRASAAPRGPCPSGAARRSRPWTPRARGSRGSARARPRASSSRARP